MQVIERLSTKLRTISTAWLAFISLLIGALLVGLAQVAVLPPYAGYDDAAHYSYVQQLADKGSQPHYRDRISAEISDYLKLAPGPDTLNPRWAYSDFFTAPPDTIETVRSAIHDKRDPNRVWRNGSFGNWEAQHPPLYYLLMTPVYRLSKGWSLADQLFLLRGASYGLAWIALCVPAIFWFREMNGKNDAGLSWHLAPAAWPLLFPMWFPEMARLGNDCLVALLAACAWIVQKTIISSNDDGYRYVVLGLICGLGLLTKAIFLPFVAATVTIFLFRIWQDRAAANIVKRRLKGLIALLVIMFTMAGWWYAETFLETGNFIGSTDIILLNKMGGLFHGLSEHASPMLFAYGLDYLIITFLWGGPLIPPLIAYVPLFLIVLLLGAGYVRQSKTLSLTAADWMPLLTLAGLLAGLFNQIAVWVALWGVALVPGYYLHSFAPVLASSVERGMAGVGKSRWLRRAMLGSMFLTLFFLALGMGVQAQYFSGCSVKRLYTLYYDVFASGPCATDVSKIIDNLSVLAFPRAAICFFVAGWIMMFGGALAAGHSLRA